ncbi:MULTISPECIES: VOC family protein [Lactococcus]|nr:hypothetical protein [Lactococcus petauri]
MFDVREIAKVLLDQGVELVAAHLPKEESPGHFYVLDPDGNKLLFDQHV